MGFVPAEKIREVTDTPLNDAVYDEELDLEFEVHLPDEYSEDGEDGTFATAAKVPFKESVNPSAREQAKLHAREEAEANDD
jgi:aminomethyltransferase